MIASETDTRRKAAETPSLAEIMLARGAQVARVAPRTVEQSVTKAEVAAEIVEDVPVTPIGEVPAVAPCSHPSCAHADPNGVCVCFHCFGAGHGWITAQVQDAARARTEARIARTGGIFQTLGTAGALAADLDAPTVPRTLAPFNPDTIIIDGEEW